MGRPWTKASQEVYLKGSFGNGAAMRVVPVILPYHDDEKQLKKISYLSSHITHSHKLGKEGARRYKPIPYL
ncbi:TPA: ADP-ribosylglycohydrolase family protein [Candidatus Bathyarchaeota archaeon]|nr:ADP-ribosylglycohydrolase family protein [Candidatus Bathyarchaeota archaeon]